MRNTPVPLEEPPPRAAPIAITTPRIAIGEPLSDTSLCGKRKGNHILD